MTHFANKYIGLPWVAGAQGPDCFDCWGFVRWVLFHEYGVIVPRVNVNPDNLRNVLTAFLKDPAFQAFKKVSQPLDGYVVLLSQSKNPVHCGLWLDIDGGGVLHCERGIGVVFQNKKSLFLSGWTLYSFYRRIENNLLKNINK